MQQRPAHGKPSGYVQKLVSINRHNVTALVAVSGGLRAPRLEQRGQLGGYGDVPGEKQ